MMSRGSKAYERLPLTGGFDFTRGKHKPSQVLKSAQRVRHKESDHQVTFFDVLRLNERQFPIFKDVYHVPNGGHRHEAVALKLRAEGVKPGIPDIHLDAARRGFHGFKCELKVERNKLGENQIYFRKRYIEEGFFTHSAWHYAELLAMLLWYLDIDIKKIQGLPNRHAIIIPAQGGQHDERCGCTDFRIANVKWW